jgi:hypothetical protein
VDLHGAGTYPAIFANPCRSYHYGGTVVSGETSDNGAVYGFDVTYQATGTPGPAPATPTDVQDSLADWFITTTDNQHQTDGLPWRTDANVSAIKTTTDAGLNLAGGLQGLSDSLAHAIQEASDWLAAGGSGFFPDLKDRLVGTSGGGGSAFYTSDGQLVSALVAQIYAGMTPARSLPPGTGWTLADETDWDTSLAWGVGAHCYLVTVDSYPPAQPATDGPAGTWLYRLGWWAVLNGSYASGRQWFEFAQQFLYLNGLWMPGLALQARGGTTGHVQAWTFG